MSPDTGLETLRCSEIRREGFLFVNQVEVGEDIQIAGNGIFIYSGGIASAFRITPEFPNGAHRPRIFCKHTHDATELLPVYIPVLFFEVSSEESFDVVSGHAGGIGSIQIIRPSASDDVVHDFGKRYIPKIPVNRSILK